MNERQECLTCERKIPESQWFCSQVCVQAEIRRQEEWLKEQGR